MKRFPHAVLAALLVLLGARAAAAQDVFVEGAGVKVGESTVIHPRVGIEGGVIANVFYEETDPVIAPVIRLLAGFDIEPGARDRHGPDSVGRPALDFKVGAELRYNEYPAGNARVRSQRNLDADLHAEVTLNPEGNVALFVGDHFVRSSRPTNFESNRQLTRDLNHFRAEARVQPGGRMLTFAARYENEIDLFESDRSEFANRMMQTVGARGTWKFFPYSQVWLDASMGFFGTIGGGDPMYKVGSNPLRIIAGVDTVITEMTTVKAYGGYANGFYDSGPTYSSFVGGVDAGWRYMPVGRVTLGYSYDIADSINANFYAEHQLRASVTQQLRRLFATVGTRVRLRGYRGVPAMVGPEAVRDDFIFELTARLEYMIRDRFSLYLDGIVQSATTEYRDAFGDDPSFTREELVGGASLAF